jgi:chaperonin cofactor prefoldin
MSLTKQDLKEIKSIVKETVDISADEVTRNLSDKIDNTKQQIMHEMDERFEGVDVRFGNLEKNISREISDLADINRAVITRTDQIDHRLRIVERKLGLIVK